MNSVSNSCYILPWEFDSEDYKFLLYKKRMEEKIKEDHLREKASLPEV